MKKRIVLVTAILAAAALAGCVEDTGPTNPTTLQRSDAGLQ